MGGKTRNVDIVLSPPHLISNGRKARVTWYVPRIFTYTFRQLSGSLSAM